MSASVCATLPYVSMFLLPHHYRSWTGGHALKYINHTSEWCKTSNTTDTCLKMKNVNHCLIGNGRITTKRLFDSIFMKQW